jgi:hypothetical protein
MVRAAPLWIAVAVLCAGCAASARNDRLADDVPDLRTHLAEKARMQEVRQRMRQVVRRVSAELPFACDAAIRAVAEARTRMDLLAVAAGAGTYSYARCATPDPRTGLADLIVTYSSIAAILDAQAALPGGESVAPVVQVVRTANDEFMAIARECFPPDLMTAVEGESARLAAAERASLYGASSTGSVLSALASGPAEFQFHSTFLSFNDNGLVEHALGEAHLLRLAVQEVADCMTQLPIALEYRARRSLVWGSEQAEVRAVREDVAGMRAELGSLRELGALRQDALAEIRGLPWKVGAGVVVALAVQGILLGCLLRRR